MCLFGYMDNPENAAGHQGGHQMNDTMKKFGYPETLVKEYENWVVLLRPQQATLGSLILACKNPAEAFSQISPAAFSELKIITTATEACLMDCFAYDKINYLLLMMVDRDVHFHVLPRYARAHYFSQVEFNDPGWPGPPDLSQINATDERLQQRLLQTLRRAFADQ
jgi:diadenosine tetraphosphate (Ap4A) HIT family hydrolase